MTKYGKKMSEKVEEVMQEFKHGDLIMNSGKIVRKRQQALAIGLFEARREGDNVPVKKRE